MFSLHEIFVFFENLIFFSLFSSSDDDMYSWVELSFHLPYTILENNASVNIPYLRVRLAWMGNKYYAVFAREICRRYPSVWNCIMLNSCIWFFCFFVCIQNFYNTKVKFCNSSKFINFYFNSCLENLSINYLNI